MRTVCAVMPAPSPGQLPATCNTRTVSPPIATDRDPHPQRTEATTRSASQLTDLLGCLGRDALTRRKSSGTLSGSGTLNGHPGKWRTLMPMSVRWARAGVGVHDLADGVR